jgi:hypothetical protein
MLESFALQAKESPALLSLKFPRFKHITKGNRKKDTYLRQFSKQVIDSKP